MIVDSSIFEVIFVVGFISNEHMESREFVQFRVRDIESLWQTTQERKKKSHFAKSAAETAKTNDEVHTLQDRNPVGELREVVQQLLTKQPEFHETRTLFRL